MQSGCALLLICQSGLKLVPGRARATSGNQVVNGGGHGEELGKAQTSHFLGVSHSTSAAGAGVLYIALWTSHKSEVPLLPPDSLFLEPCTLQGHCPPSVSSGSSQPRVHIGPEAH